MRVRLLGTGAADGWPNPFCPCASCGTERAAGRVRGQSAALVDDTVLVDCGPATPAAAERLGASLAGVRLLLWTHQHADHCSPAVLMFREWVSGPGGAPLTVLAPPDVVAAARPWLPPDSPVTFVPVQPGERHDVHGYAVRVLAAAHATGLGATDDADAVLYDLTGPDGTRLLWATDTGPLPAATLAAAEGAAYDLVLLEETFGDRTDLAGGTAGSPAGHLDLVTFPEQLRRLRAVGALAPTTDVVAVHLSHHNPPTPELARRLAGWGARVVDDGAELVCGEVVREPATDAPRPVPPAPRRTLVLGGARSGKSREAERLLAAADDVTYVATSYPPGEAGDPEQPDREWADRVARHRAQRPAHWRTEETLDLAGHLATEGGPLLVDCLTLWLTRVFDAHAAWDDATWAGGAADAVAAEVATLVRAWTATTRRVVAVSNEVGQGLVPDSAALRRWRDEMGRLNAALAAASEDVRWCVAGRVVGL